MTTQLEAVSAVLLGVIRSALLVSSIWIFQGVKRRCAGDCRNYKGTGKVNKKNNCNVIILFGSV